MKEGFFWEMLPLSMLGRIGLFSLAFVAMFEGSAFAQDAQPSATPLEIMQNPLAGKKICLDAGHGGPSYGAVGVKGLKEKDVDLREAYLLKGLLEKAGAVVVLTRTDDKDVSLGDRCKFNRDQKTDLFVSIHHNANAQNDKSVNRTESFYHWKDREGPSEDAARLVHREMQALLKLPDSKAYVCWSYGMLRENSYPAILIEPSYLANPEEEERLRDEKYLLSIAEAYFRGIRAFFAGGRPRIEISGNLEPSPDGAISARILCPPGTALTDPQRIRAEVDGNPLQTFSFVPETGELKLQIPPATGLGTHELVLSARNLAGHTSFVERRKFELKTALQSQTPENKKGLFMDVLKGKKIIVDPQGGGGDPSAIGEKGLRASDANLTTILYLYDYLVCAGASVSITRVADVSMDNVARVRFALERDPDVFLTIGHRLPEPGMDEKPRMNVSRIGSRWDSGQEIGQRMISQIRQILGTGSELGDVKSLKALPSEVHNWSSWEVMHAGQRYTAIYVCPQMFDAPGVEERISTTAGCRKEALAVLYGLVRNFGMDDSTMASLEGIVIDQKNGKSLRDALVWMDGILVTQTESDGKFIFKFLDPGKHSMRIMCLGYPPVVKEIDVEKEKVASIRIDLPAEK